MRAAQTMLTVRVKGPFNLRLSLAGAASFLPIARTPEVLTEALDVGSIFAVVTVSQALRRLSSVHASSTPEIDEASLKEITKWLVWSDLDLRPFYRLAKDHSTMRPVVSSLAGLKPLRPATLFEMGIVAITEQQLSLAAAFHIRNRLVSRFGAGPVGQSRFPSAESLAAASLEVLQSCGLSRRKAEYVKKLASSVIQGALDFDALKLKCDDRIREELLAIRGFGEWSVDYMLSRGVRQGRCPACGRRRTAASPR
jgi:3-methyladenine DNA glycosylase/8-oxoguanine DNA glycosylase